MEEPIRVTFRGIPESSFLYEEIVRRLQGIEKVFGHVTTCNVLVEQGHHRRKQGHTVRVGIDLRVPGRKIVVSREHTLDGSHDSPLIAVRDGFDALRRKLQNYRHRRRGEVKIHESHYHQGRIARVMAEDGYGFIEDEGGREVYFHENAILQGSIFDLSSGMRVKFIEEIGENGPQASTVAL